MAFVQCSSRIERAVEQRIGPAGDVARGDDPRRGQAGLVAHHAVVEREPRTFEPRPSRARRRHRPRRRRPSTTEPSPSRTPRTRPAPSSSIASTCTPVRRSTPWSRWIAASTAPSSGPEAAHHRLRQHLEHRDVEVAGAARRRDLGADEARADDDDLRAARRAARASASASSSVRKVNRPARFGWFGSRRGVAPGRDHEPVERDALAVVQLDLVSVGVAARPRARRGASRGRGRRRPVCATRPGRAPSRRAAAPWRAAGGRRAGAARRRSRRCARRSPRAGTSPRRADPASEVPTMATVRIARRTYQLAGILTWPSYLRPLARPRRGVAACPSRPPPAPAGVRTDVPPTSTCRAEPLHLRDVDIGAFLHPEDDRGDRRVGAVGEAEHRDDAQVLRSGRRRTGRRSIRCTPSARPCSGTRVTSRCSTSPATSTSRSSSPAAPRRRSRKCCGARRSSR